jgi:hypothetical protein
MAYTAACELSDDYSNQWDCINERKQSESEWNVNVISNSHCITYAKIEFLSYIAALIS